MTLEELTKIPFRFVSHLNMEHEHCSVYANDEYDFVMCKRTKVVDGVSCGRTITHYKHNGKVYKSLPKFVEAIKNVEYKEKKTV